METFETGKTALTMKDSETGRILTANVYYVEGIDAPLSMGQLVMAICLSRANDVETELVAKMDEVDRASEKIAALTSIQQELVNWYDTHTVSDTFDFTLTSGWTFDYDGKTYDNLTWRRFLVETCEMDGVDLLNKDSLTHAEVEDLINTVGDKMDAYNSVSQSTLIKIQSLTSKRDQSYDLVTNVLKSFNTQLMGLANNI